MNNSKNLLQEYCQKNHLHLPVYEISILEINDYIFFQSKVNIVLKDGTKLKATGNLKKNKKAAEKAVAEELLDVLNEYLDKNKIRFNVNLPTRILIDLENIYLGDLFLNYDFSDNFIFEGFSTSHSSCLNALDSDKIIIHTVKSTRRDAADVRLILYVSSLISSSEKINLIVVTSDHFGDSLMDCLEDMQVESLFSFKCVKSLDELVEYLEELQ